NHARSLFEETEDASLAAQAFRDGLRRSDGVKTSEERWLGELGSAALVAGQTSRITLTGWGADDVVELLDADLFMPGAGGWTQVHDRRCGDHGGKELKKFLQEDLDADLSDDGLRTLVARMDHVPPALRELLDDCSRQSTPRGL